MLICGRLLIFSLPLFFCTFAVVNGFIIYKMKIGNIFSVALCLILASCADAPMKHYGVTSVEGKRIEVTKVFDNSISNETLQLIAPYKAAVDSVMCPVLGESVVFMEAARPESLLSNWIADVLVEEAGRSGFDVDMGLSNIGGMRSAMPQGNVTVGDVMAIAPFENRLCVLTLTGEDVLELFRQIAAVGGEGVSGSVRMRISEDKILVDVTLNGKSIEAGKTYRIATIDYLAEGNDGMKALKKAVKREDTQLLMREMLMGYIKRQTDAGKKLDSKIEGRIIVGDK